MVIDIIFENMFGRAFQPYEVIFEVYIEDKLTNRQAMQAPKEILMANFLQTVQQIQDDNRPIKIKMLRPEIICNNFDSTQKTIDNEISFSNKAMICWEENKKGDE